MTKKKDSEDKILLFLSFFILSSLIIGIVNTQQINYSEWECIDWKDTYPEDLYILTDFEENGGNISLKDNWYVIHSSVEGVDKHISSYSIYNQYINEYGTIQHEPVKIEKYILISEEYGNISINEDSYNILKEYSNELIEPVKVCTKSMLVKNYD